MDFFEIELLCIFLEQVSEEAIFKYYKMIICNVQGGFGNHLLCVCLGIILANKYNINIKIVFIYANGINNFSKDTINPIYEIVNVSIIVKDNEFL